MNEFAELHLADKNAKKWAKAYKELLASHDHLLEALEAAEQYLAFHSSEGCEPVPLQKVRAAIKAAPRNMED